MATIERTALVEYSAEQMFDLVNDIEQYPKFLPGCKSARVIRQSETELLGELYLVKAGISRRFITRNRLKRPASVIMRLEQGDFSRFAASWRFESLAANACKVSFDMEFEFKSGLLDYAAEKLFGNLADSQVDAMVARAGQVYG